MLWKILTPCVRWIGDDSGVGVNDVVGVEGMEEMEARVSFIERSLAASARQQHLNFTFPAPAGPLYSRSVDQHCIQ